VVVVKVGELHAVVTRTALKELGGNTESGSLTVLADSGDALVDLHLPAGVGQPVAEDLCWYIQHYCSSTGAAQGQQAVDQQMSSRLAVFAKCHGRQHIVAVYHAADQYGMKPLLDLITQDYVLRPLREKQVTVQHLLAQFNRHHTIMDAMERELQRLLNSSTQVIAHRGCMLAAALPATCSIYHLIGIKVAITMPSATRSQPGGVQKGYTGAALHPEMPKYNP
jgi:hypothetical protein